jgi:hypothetical protein
MCQSFYSAQDLPILVKPTITSPSSYIFSNFSNLYDHSDEEVEDSNELVDPIASEPILHNNNNINNQNSKSDHFPIHSTPNILSTSSAEYSAKTFIHSSIIEDYNSKESGDDDITTDPFQGIGLVLFPST